MRGRCIAIAGLMLLGAAGALWAGPFTEVRADHWAYPSCARLVALDVMPPDRAGGFSGDPQFTRFEFGVDILEPLSAVDTIVSLLPADADSRALLNAAARALGLSPNLSEDEIAQVARDLVRLAEEFDDVLRALGFDPKPAVAALDTLTSSDAVRAWRTEALSRPMSVAPFAALAPGDGAFRMPLAHGTLALTVGRDLPAPELLDYFARSAAEGSAGEPDGPAPPEPALRDPTVSRLRTAYEYGFSSALTLSLAYEEIARQGQGLAALDAASLASFGIGYKLTPSTSVKLSYSLLEYSNYVFDTPPVRDRVAETAVSIEF